MTNETKSKLSLEKEPEIVDPLFEALALLVEEECIKALQESSN